MTVLTTMKSTGSHRLPADIRQPPLTAWLQSEPPQPCRHSQLPRLHTPWPEQKFRSVQASSEWILSEMQVLQHCAGAMGTRSAIRVILHDWLDKKFKLVPGFGALCAAVTGFHAARVVHI